MSSRETVFDTDDLRVVGERAPSTIDLRDTITGVRPLEEGRGRRALRNYAVVGLWLAVIDALCLAAALMVAHELRFGTVPHLDYFVGLAVACAVWVGVFHAFGLYAPHHLSGIEEFRRTVGAAGIGIVVVILLTFWLDVYLSRSWMALTFLIALPLEIGARRVVRMHVMRRRHDGSLAFRTLIVGTGEHAAELSEALDLPGSGFLPLGYLDASSPLICSTDLSPRERVERLRAVIREHDPDCLFIASPTIGLSPMLAINQAARQEGVEIRIYTHLTGILTSRLTVQPIGKEGMALTLKPARLTATQRLIKRGLDLGIGTVGLVLALPVIAVIAAAIKLTSRGPVIFRQKRVTEGDRTFSLYKFRTMTNGGDESLEGDVIDTTRPFFKLKDDPRLTKLGGLLRKWSLDELPQLFNVLRGDMSLVGPRPLPADQVSANLELLSPRHEVRAGVTGWWQIQGRSEVDPEDALRMDMFYIENWSPALDVYILLRTLGVLVTRKGAY